MTKVKFILSTISSGWLVWSINLTSIYENSELNIFKNMKSVGEISNKLSNDLLGANVYNTFEFGW